MDAISSSSELLKDNSNQRKDTRTPTVIADQRPLMLTQKPTGFFFLANAITRDNVAQQRQYLGQCYYALIITHVLFILVDNVLSGQ